MENDIKRAAIQGEAVPQDLEDAATVRCLIRGIRHHDGFASKLRESTTNPSILRAFNARDLMSNRVPVMQHADDVPYCFWHPDVPSEETLRQLLVQSPSLTVRYQVGRACAAGGYTALYKELDLIPDVAIAEEARDNTASGRQIYNLIMEAPTRYNLMDDYTRTVRKKPTPGAVLNGDTCVRSLLDRKQDIDKGLHEPYFDIAEDWNVGTEGDVIGSQPIQDEVIALLYSPLPANLPVIDKDLLILMAAWSGNIDRYIRLRRPTMIRGERQCITRGIYCDTFFAKWCYGQPGLRSFRKFVYARCIMNNDLSWANDDVPETDLPYIIWYPKKACEETYVELADRYPSMVSAAALALMAINLPEEFENIEPVPTYDMWEASDRHSNKFYAEYIERKMDELGIDLSDNINMADYSFPPSDPDTMMVVYEMNELEIRGNRADLYKEITLDHIGYKYAEYYNPKWLKHMGNVLLYVSTHPQKLVPNNAHVVDMSEVYRDAVWVDNEEDRKMVGVHPNPNRPRGGYVRRTRGNPCSKRPRGGRRGGRDSIGRGHRED